MRLYFSLSPQRGLEVVLLQSFLARNGQFLAAFRPAAGQYFAAIGSLHTLAETMNGFAATLMWLECTFH